MLALSFAISNVTFPQGARSGPGPATVPASHSESSPASLQTVELVREAVASFSEQSIAARRFTYFELAHTQNRNFKGKLFFDRTTLTERTYIADLHFDRLVEIDGRPLTGSALAAEQARYDQAVHDRVALDTAARARLDRQHFIDGALPFSQLITRFRLTELRRETIQIADGSEIAHVIAHRPSIQPMLHSPRSELHNMVEIGLATGDAKNKPIQLDVERAFSRYRQFATSIRVIPAQTSPTAAPR